MTKRIRPTLVCGTRSSIGDLRGGEGEEEEEEGTRELSHHGNEVVANSIRQPFEARKAVLVVRVAFFVLEERQTDTARRWIDVHGGV